MVIRITKQAPLTSTCCGCKSEMEFEPDDLEMAYFHGDYTEAGPAGVGVRCPRCNTLTEFKAATGDMITAATTRRAAARENSR